MLKHPPSIDVVLLSWNRKELLETTVLSLLSTGPKTMNLIVVDNDSSDGAAEWLTDFAKKNDRISIKKLSKNMGGRAFNSVFKDLKSDFILFSENDLEYQPGWWIEMTLAFLSCPQLGQLSPMSPFPDVKWGEVWGVKPHKNVKLKNGYTVTTALGNVGTSCMVKKSVLKAGVTWKNLESPNNQFLFPADGEFSNNIRELGLWIAWSATSQVKNWGHNSIEWKKNPDYYTQNWNSKATHSIDGLKDLNQEKEPHGVTLQKLESLKTRYRKLQRNISDTNILEKIGIEYETTTLFLGENGHFSSNRSILKDINPCTRDFKVSFELDSSNAISSLRWDPIEGSFCRILIKKISLNPKGSNLIENVAIEELHYSPHITKHNKITFETTDPQVIIPCQGYFSQITIEGSWEIFDS